MLEVRHVLALHIFRPRRRCQTVGRLIFAGTCFAVVGAVVDDNLQAAANLLQA
jgi:hypothetical protein